MALIKCKECGKEISDKASTCPNCGCPIIISKKIICQECGNSLKENDKICSKCGCPIKESKIKLSNKKVVLFIGGIIIIIILAVIIFSSFSNKEYYCESEEHELRGRSCVVKVKKSMSKRYYCKNGRTPYGGSDFLKWCDTYTLAEEEYYCETGYQEGIECVVSESTYDALVK